MDDAPLAAERPEQEPQRIVDDKWSNFDNKIWSDLNNRLQEPKWIYRLVQTRVGVSRILVTNVPHLFIRSNLNEMVVSSIFLLKLSMFFLKFE